MEFKGTKGPWKFDGVDHIHSENGTAIAAGFSHSTRLSLDESTANYELMADAPELLEAIQYEVSLLEHERAKNGWNKEEAAKHSRLIKVIKKHLNN